jgi:hypothetical protein
MSQQKIFQKNPGVFITQELDNISPIASGKRVRFGNEIET